MSPMFGMRLHAEAFAYSKLLRARCEEVAHKVAKNHSGLFGSHIVLDTKIKIHDPSQRRILVNKYFMFTFETPRGLYPQIRNNMGTLAFGLQTSQFLTGLR